MDGVAKFLSENPSLAVAVTLGCIAATAALLGLIATLWVKPKVKKIDDLSGELTKLEARFQQLPNFPDLLALVNRLDGERGAERKGQAAVIEETIKRLESLHTRSKKELERMVEAKEIDWAIEQAGQDVELAQSVELFSRLSDTDRHKAAQERLAKAQRRLDQLQKQSQGVKQVSASEEL